MNCDAVWYSGRKPTFRITLVPHIQDEMKMGCVAVEYQRFGGSNVLTKVGILQQTLNGVTSHETAT